jgi:hypothetical protein
MGLPNAASEFGKEVLRREKIEKKTPKAVSLEIRVLPPSRPKITAYHRVAEKRFSKVEKIIIDNLT